MPSFYDQLKKAAFENLTSDPSSGLGRFWIRTDTSPVVVRFYDGSAVRTVVTLDNTQTLTNKTLTSPVITTPTIDIASMTEQGSTPSSPSAGTRKLYVKDDGYPYLLDSAGTETRIGTGTSTGINYILNPDAETATTGWTTYDDGASATPVDGTGGTVTTTLTRVTSSPIRGAAMFRITKDASDRQGEGVAYAFSIARGDQGKVLALSFEYTPGATFVPGDSSDLKVFVYDVTNSQIIPVTPNAFYGNTGVYTKFYGTFQTNSNSTSYRLLFHVASTNASAWTFDFDNVVVGPQTSALGVPATDWEAYTTTLSDSTNATVVSYYRRIGDSAEFFGRIVWSGGGGGSNLAATIKSGLVIDTSKLPDTSVMDIGTGEFADSGGTLKSIQVRYASTTSFSFVVSAESSLFNGSSATNGDVLTFRVVVPILGWSSNVVMSNAADTRVCAARYKISGSSTNIGIADEAYEIIDFDTKVFDTHAAVTTGASWKFTAPMAGIYVVRASINWASLTNLTAYFLNVYKNGSDYARIMYFSGTTDVLLPGYALVSLSAADYIDVRVFQNDSGGSSRNLATDGLDINIDIFRLSGPTSVMAAERVFARYSTNTAQSISNNSATIVNFEDKTVDSHGAVAVGASWAFTAPRADVYRVSAIVSLASDAGWEAGETAYIALYKNGALYSYLDRFICQATATMTVSMSGSDEIQLSAADYINIYVYQNSDGAIALDGGTEQNRVSISAVGNK